MIEQILAEFAEVTGRQFADRQNTIGASEIGQCARKIFFAKNAGDRIYGVDSDEDYVDAWGATLRGNLFEDYLWVPALLARYGDKLKFAGENKQTFIDEFLSATPDGLLVDQSRNALADFDIDDIGGDG